MRAGVANPFDARDRVDLAEQAREGRLVAAARQIATVGVDILSEQRDLAHAVRGHRAHLAEKLGGGSAGLAAARRRHDAVGARAVAADADLQPALVGPLAPSRQLAAE